MMKVTLEDIARQSGVSKTTASFVLNNKQTSMGISDGTIERVRQVMEELNYKPNSAAVQLGRRKQRRAKILLLTPWLHQSNSQFMSEVTRAIEDAKISFKVDYEMYIPGELKKFFKPKAINNYKAVLIIGTSIKDDEFLLDVKRIVKNKIFLLNRKIDCFCGISGSDYSGGQVIADYVFKTNYYKKFVIINLKNQSQVMNARSRGMADYFVKFVHRKPKYFETLNSTDEAVFEKETHDILKRYGKDRVCLFTMQDRIAVRFMSQILRMGINVPEEIGITGYDNDPIASLVIPSITSMDSKIYKMARDVLEKIINSDENSQSQTLEIMPELVIRESVMS